MAHFPVLFKLPQTEQNHDEVIMRFLPIGLSFQKKIDKTVRTMVE